MGPFFAGHKKRLKVIKTKNIWGFILFKLKIKPELDQERKKYGVKQEHCSEILHKNLYFKTLTQKPERNSGVVFLRDNNFYFVFILCPIKQ